MKAELGLPSVKGDDEHGGGMTGGFGGSMGGAGQGGKGKRPISVKFEIPYFTTSGIQVRYLKIIEPKVRAVALSLLLASLLLVILGVPGRRVGIGRAKLARAALQRPRLPSPGDLFPGASHHVMQAIWLPERCDGPSIYPAGVLDRCFSLSALVC